MSDEGAHRAGLGERQRLAIVGLASSGIELVGMRRDVAEQVVGVGRAPALGRRMGERVVRQTMGLVELVEPQGRAAQRIAGLSVDPDDTRPASRSRRCSPSRRRASASAVSPTCASAQAEHATA